jgi:glycosyltransferase involved in cell wall biosynthesis
MGWARLPVARGANIQERKKHMLAYKPESSTIVAEVSDFTPARILEIELAQPLPVLTALDAGTGRIYRRAFCLVRLHTRPMGVVELRLDPGEVSADEYARQIWRQLAAQINEHLQQDGLAPLTQLDVGGLTAKGVPACIEERTSFLSDAPFVSVIVPTHDRLEQVQKCLHSLLAIQYPRYEVIVVDNAPSTNATADCIQHIYCDVPQVRYLREARPGVSWARNCGLLAARGEILAFVDDDVVVDPYWLVELVMGFGLAEDVVCVTGYILPIELETPAQFWYEEHCGFYQSFARRIFDLAENHPRTPLYPYRAGEFGSGANMAFRAPFLRGIDGFDPALGGSGPSRCAQDIAAFFQVIIRGHKLVYSPASMVFHLNLREYAKLRKQIYYYGIGLTAYLTKSMLEKPGLLLDFIPRMLYTPSLILSSLASKGSKKSLPYPRELVMLKLKGMLYGPLAYLRSRKALAQTTRAAALLEAPAILPVEKEF